MDVLVTGSRGLIGQQVVAELTRRRHHVRGLDIRDGEDVNDSHQLRLALRGADAAIHLASPSSPILFERDRDKSWATTVGPLYTILDEFRGHVVCASSGKVYGPTDTPASEGGWLPPPTSDYAAAKRECERLCFQAVAHGRKRRVRVCRIFTTYGSNEAHKYEQDAASTPYNFVTAALAGEPIEVYGDGSQMRDFVHVDDVARGLVDALEARTCPPLINIGTGTPTSFLRLLDIVRAATGHEVEVAAGGRPTGYAQCLLADSRRARQALAWRPLLSIEDGIGRIVAEIGEAR